MTPFMIKSWRHSLRLLAGVATGVCAALLFPPASKAEFDAKTTRSWELSSPAILKFQYRLFPQAEVEKITVVQDGKPLEFRRTPFANNPMNTSAILVLVDTSVGSSRTPRDKTIKDNKFFIQALLAKAQSRNLIGVYSFANDLVEITPIGSPFPETRNKIGSLKADGLGTRIYREGMEAVSKLSAVQASRKALLILSDGKDEDNGFTREDLIKAARTHGVMVFAMGCPETEAEVPTLGNLEKIALETGGIYTQAPLETGSSGERLKSDAAFAQALLDSVDAGEDVAVALEGADASADITFDLVTRGGEKLAYVHKRPL